MRDIQRQATTAGALMGAFASGQITGQTPNILAKPGTPPVPGAPGGDIPSPPGANPNPDLTALGLGTGAGGPAAPPLPPTTGAPGAPGAPPPAAAGQPFTVPDIGAGAGVPTTPTIPTAGTAPLMPHAAGGITAAAPATAADGPAPRPVQVAGMTLSRDQLAALMPPGVRPIGTVIPAPILFRVMADAIERDRRGEPLPELPGLAQHAAGGITAGKTDMRRALVDTSGGPDTEAITALAAFTPEERQIWEGANSGPPAPPVFEDWLIEVAPESDNPFAKDLADMIQQMPSLTDTLWNVAVTIAKQAPDELPSDLLAIIRQAGTPIPASRVGKIDAMNGPSGAPNPMQPRAMDEEIPSPPGIA